ncbi:MAG: hypothetical protein ACQESR_08645 [Planctomycetota bacterium]
MDRNGQIRGGRIASRRRPHVRGLSGAPSRGSDANRAGPAGKRRGATILQAAGFVGGESCPTRAVLPLVALAADKVIRDRSSYCLFF